MAVQRAGVGGHPALRFETGYSPADSLYVLTDHPDHTLRHRLSLDMMEAVVTPDSSFDYSLFELRDLSMVTHSWVVKTNKEGERSDTKRLEKCEIQLVCQHMGQALPMQNNSCTHPG